MVADDVEEPDCKDSGECEKEKGARHSPADKPVDHRRKRRQQKQEIKQSQGERQESDCRIQHFQRSPDSGDYAQRGKISHENLPVRRMHGGSPHHPGVIREQVRVTRLDIVEFKLCRRQVSEMAVMGDITRRFDAEVPEQEQQARQKKGCGKAALEARFFIFPTENEGKEKRRQENDDQRRHDEIVRAVERNQNGT